LSSDRYTHWQNAKAALIIHAHSLKDLYRNEFGPILEERFCNMEVMEFMWKGTRHQVAHLDSQGTPHTLIKMPGPKHLPFDVIRDDFLEYTDTTRPLDPGDEWKKESAEHFLHWLRKAAEITQNRGRSVWFMARPLQKRIFPAVSEGLIALSHWGLLISRFSKGQMTDRMNRNTTDEDEIWGDLHELRNFLGKARYECEDFKAADYQRATRFTYLGQTEMTDEALHEYG
jgi:hypothetical protein